eukprot:2198395-Amphidinium_carterae.1
MSPRWKAYKSAPVHLRPRSRSRTAATALRLEGFASGSADILGHLPCTKLAKAEAILRHAPDRVQALQTFNDNALAESSRRAQHSKLSTSLNVSLFPLSAETFGPILAAMTQAGYRSVPSYIAVARCRNVQLGFDLPC